jgi:hypothetical protein
VKAWLLSSVPRCDFPVEEHSDGTSALPDIKTGLYKSGLDIRRDAGTFKRVPFDISRAVAHSKPFSICNVMSHDAQDILRFGKKKFVIALHLHVSQAIRANLSNQVNFDTEAHQFVKYHSRWKF